MFHHPPEPGKVVWQTGQPSRQLPLVEQGIAGVDRHRYRQISLEKRPLLLPKAVIERDWSNTLILIQKRFSFKDKDL